MSDFTDDWDHTYRDKENIGQPLSPDHNPDKSEIRDLGHQIDTRFAGLEAAQQGGFIVLATWAELNAFPTAGLDTGTAGQVVNDPGTHTDPVVGGTVDNEGVYSFVEGEGWQRIADLGVDILGARLTIAESDIDGLQAQMPTKASKDELYLSGQSPSVGFLTGMLTPPARIVLDVDGHAIGAFDKDNVSYALGSDGVWAPNSPEPDPAELARTSASVSLPAARVPNGYGAIIVPAQLVTSALPGSTAVTAEAMTLKYASAATLVYQYPRTVVVTKTAGAVVLTEGVDYSVDYSNGTITGLVNTADIPCTVAYSGKKQRIDYVSVSRDTGALTVTGGTEVARNAAMWEPTLPTGELLVWRIYRWVDGSAVTPAYRFQNRVRLGAQAAYDRRLEVNRTRLQRFRSKLMSGANVRYGTTGDSIINMGAIEAIMNTTPNGRYRDLIGYFATYDTATRAMIPTYDLGDGMGQVHIREGQGWKVALAIAERYGVTVDYANWGIGGTTSANTSFVNDGVTVYNGSAATRLNATVADDCDAINICFGQNELGSTSTYANLLVIGEAHLNADQDVIFTTPTRRSPLSAGEAYTSWRYTCDAISAAADTLGVACVWSVDVLDVPNLGAVPIAGRELSLAGPPNHPGKKELDAMAALIAEIF